MLIRDGSVYKRYEVKPGNQPPASFEAASEIDPETGKQQGWVPLVGDDPADRLPTGRLGPASAFPAV